MTENSVNLFILVVVGGLIGYLAGFGVMATYGGIYGCFPWADNLFNSTGYISCGYLGGIFGGILGIIIDLGIFELFKRRLL